MSEFQAFVDAIKLGNLESFVQLYKPDYLNKKDKQSWCAIHYACQFGHKEVLEKLISWNCDINQMGGRNGLLPIQLACSEGQTDIVALLTQAECDIDIKCLENSLMKCPNEKIVDILKGRKFLLACKKGDLETVRSMLTDVNVEYCDKDNRRPIHWAVEGGHTEIVKLLLEQYCDIDPKDKAGLAPSDIAKDKKYTDLIKIFEENLPERPLRKLISSMGVKCSDTCDHKLCPTSIRKKVFEGGTKIGHGTFGDVYKFQESVTGRLFAVKTMFINKVNAESLKVNINAFQNILNHERIIKYYGAITEDTKLYIVMEYVVNGSLEDKINKKKNDMKNDDIVRYSKQVLEGLEHLHKIGIIHRDLKPGNILLDGEDNVKLADFGIGRVLDKGIGSTIIPMTLKGSEYFTAPEIGTGNQYGTPVDIWSLGATVLFMLTDIENVKGLKDLVTPQMSELLDINKVPKEMVTFLEYMLVKDPKRRWTAEALLKLEMFRNLKKY